MDVASGNHRRKPKPRPMTAEEFMQRVEAFQENLEIIGRCNRSSMVLRKPKAPRRKPGDEEVCDLDGGIWEWAMTFVNGHPVSGVCWIDLNLNLENALVEKPRRWAV